MPSSPKRAVPDTATLRRRLKVAELLTKSSHALNATLELDQLLGRILRIVKEALAVETASVLLVDERTDELVFDFARGKRGREIVGRRIAIGDGVAGAVAKTGEPLVINDLREDRHFSREIEERLGLQTHSIMSIPLRRRSKLIGVIEAVNRVRNEPFTREDLDVFLALGDHIATAIDNARLYEEAERSRLENSLLYQISVAIGKALTLDEVLDQILTSLRRLIAYDAAAIFVLDGKNHELVSYTQRGYGSVNEDRLRLKLDEGVVGWAAQHRTGVIVPDVSQDARYVNARGRTRAEMVTPMMSHGRVVGLFNLESNRRNAYSTDDLRLLDSFAAKAGVSIERARLYEDQKEKQEIEQELRLARTVQEFFTPRRSRRMGKFTLTGRNYPSLELSGDYLDFFPLQDPYVAFAIADVAGKGVPASIIMAGFRSTLHTAAPYYSSARDIALRANQILLETVRPHDFVTAFIGVMNKSTGEVSYCNAGHDPPVLIDRDGSYELLEAGGTVLGVLEDNELREERFRLDGRVFFAYTDGTIDATNPDGEPFGRERLLRFLVDHRSTSPARLCTLVRRELNRFTRGAELVDDITFLVIK